MREAVGGNGGGRGGLPPDFSRRGTQTTNVSSGATCTRLDRARCQKRGGSRPGEAAGNARTPHHAGLFPSPSATGAQPTGWMGRTDRHRHVRTRRQDGVEREEVGVGARGCRVAATRPHWKKKREASNTPRRPKATQHAPRALQCDSNDAREEERQRRARWLWGGQRATAEQKRECERRRRSLDALSLLGSDLPAAKSAACPLRRPTLLQGPEPDTVMV